MRGHLRILAAAPRTAAMHHGWRVRWEFMDDSLSYGHHGISPCITHPEKELCHWCRLGPILTPETTGHTPVAVLGSGPERRLGTV